MKIEICEQMLQSWLLNCKLCEISQVNWKISPLYMKKSCRQRQDRHTKTDAGLPAEVLYDKSCRPHGIELKDLFLYIIPLHGNSVNKFKC